MKSFGCRSNDPIIGTFHKEEVNIAIADNTCRLRKDELHAGPETRCRRPMQVTLRKALNSIVVRLGYMQIEIPSLSTEHLRE